MRKTYALDFAFEEGAIMGTACAMFLGIFLCIPVSYCRFPRYLCWTMIGTMTFGLPWGLLGERGIPIALYLSPLGFLLGNLLVMIAEASRADAEGRIPYDK